MIEVQELNTYFFLPIGWRDDQYATIKKFYDNLSKLSSDITDLLLSDASGDIDLLTIEVDVEVLLKPKPKEEDLSINFWLDYATGNIDVNQL